MLDKITEAMTEHLFETLCKLQTPEDCKKMLTDLCSVNEILQMAQRLRAAELLLSGKTYAQVIAETGISSATLSRVSACTRHGAGGYLKFLKNDMPFKQDKN